jgi:hypothetical protein
MGEQRAMGWYWFFVTIAATLVVGLLIIAAVVPETPHEIERFIRRDVMPLWNHGQDPQLKVPPLVREDKSEGTLVRIRPE